MSQGSYKKLFIIDDDVEDQEIFKEAIKEIDNTILCYSATSGEEALRATSAGGYAPSRFDLSRPEYAKA